MTMSYHVVPLRLEEHREALLALWKRNFKEPWMDATADRRLEWLYRDNPFGPAQTWLAVDAASNEVIGCGSVSPSHKYIRGRVVRMGTTIDFTVESRHRSAGAALAIQRALTTESRRAGFDYLIGKPNRKAMPIFTRTGYQPIGDCRNWVKALDGDAEGQALDRSCSDELVRTADERFDQLWNAAKSQDQIVGEKTAAYLNWRYLALEELNYGLYCVCNRSDGRLVAYLVYARMDNGAFIAELFAEDLFGPRLRDLLLGFADRMRMEGREWIALSYLGAPSFEDRLRQLGFSPRSSTRGLVAYVDSDCSDDFRREIFDAQHSLVFGGEMDLF
jgi:Acetyltransferase (GNAT) domain